MSRKISIPSFLHHFLIISKCFILKSYEECCQCLRQYKTKEFEHCFCQYLWHPTLSTFIISLILLSNQNPQTLRNLHMYKWLSVWRHTSHNHVKILAAWIIHEISDRWQSLVLCIKTYPGFNITSVSGSKHATNTTANIISHEWKRQPRLSQMMFTIGPNWTPK